MAKRKLVAVLDLHQPFDKLGDTHIYYFVQAGENVEVRACKRTEIKRVLEMYKYSRTAPSSLTAFTSKWAWPKQLPVLTDKTAGKLIKLFPHNDWERTSYSLGTGCDFISEMSFDELKHWFNYMFWDSTTEFMAKHGLPTMEDCKIWERRIWNEEHLSDEQKEYLLEAIHEYLDPVIYE